MELLFLNNLKLTWALLVWNENIGWKENTIHSANILFLGIKSNFDQIMTLVVHIVEYPQNPWYVFINDAHFKRLATLRHILRIFCIFLWSLTCLDLYMSNTSNFIPWQIYFWWKFCDSFRICSQMTKLYTMIPKSFIYL